MVDAGRSKQKVLAEGGALAEYAVRWISKASAQQRAGRSGRTGPGHCYRSCTSTQAKILVAASAVTQTRLYCCTCGAVGNMCGHAVALSMDLGITKGVYIGLHWPRIAAQMKQEITTKQLCHPIA